MMAALAVAMIINNVMLGFRWRKARHPPRKQKPAAEPDGECSYGQRKPRATEACPLRHLRDIRENRRECQAPVFPVMICSVAVAVTATD